ncbi:MAG: hypothetical protein WCR19_00315 [Acholeplasmataceae bacterium]
MKKKIYFNIIVLLIIAFSLVLGFVLDDLESMTLLDRTSIILYWISKGFVLALLIIFGIYVSTVNNDRGNQYVLLKFVLAIQLLPFVLRLLLKGDNSHIVLAVIVLFITVIGFVALFFSMDILNDRINEVKPTLEGKSIPVVDEDAYFDKQGKFTSANDKKVK